MLTAYLDETGQEKKGLVVVGGFIGDKSAWERCALAWREAMADDRPTLHMKRFSFTTNKNRLLLERLGPIPESCGLKRVWGSVDVSDYYDLVEGTVGEVHAHGYSLALIPLIVSIRDKVANGERFELLFEEQTALGFYRDKMLSMIHSTFPPHTHYQQRKNGPQRTQLAGWGSKPKGSTCLFEPADYLCYHLANRESAPDSKKTQWTLPIMGNGESFHDHLSKERTRNLFGYLRNGPHNFTEQDPEELKRFKAAIRKGEIDDPWDELLAEKKKHNRGPLQSAKYVVTKR